MASERSELLEILPLISTTPLVDSSLFTDVAKLTTT